MNFEELQAKSREPYQNIEKSLILVGTNSSILIAKFCLRISMRNVILHIENVFTLRQNHLK